MIYGTRVKQARELRGLTQAELASKIDRDQSLIAHIENGLKHPSDELLSVIATQTNRQISYFSLPPGEELPGGSLLWRAHASITRKEATEALRHAELLFGFAVHLTKRVNPLPVQLVPRAERPKEAARHTRMGLGVAPSLPLSLLIRTLEHAGVWVLPIPKLEGRDAFSIWAQFNDTEVPIMAVSVGQPGDRLRFSIAHELGHLVMHKTLPMKTMREIEDEANEFAAEFLLPESAMTRELQAPVTLTSVARLKPKWGVSMQALICRAHDIGSITDRQYRYLFQQLSAKGWRTAEPSNLHVAVENPRLIAKLAEVVYGTPLKYSKIAADMYLSESEAKDIMKNFASKEDFEEDPIPLSGNVVRFQKRTKSTNN